MVEDSLESTLKNLPPAERIKAVRRLRLEKKKELEDLERKRKEELKEAERLLKESLEDMEDEELENKKRIEELRDYIKRLQQTEEETEKLEEMVYKEKVNSNNEGSYRVEQEYTPINQIVYDLNKLQYTKNWGRREAELYRTRKEELELASQYASRMTKEVIDQLDTAKNILERMGYKR